MQIPAGCTSLLPVRLQRRTLARSGALWALLGAAALLAGCVVGPNYSPPSAPRAATYTRAPPASHLTTAGEPPQHLVSGEAVAQAWWQLFHSRALDAVVRAAMAGNQTVQAARARLAAARQSVTAARGPFYPQLDASAMAGREKGPSFAAGLLNPRKVPTYDLYSVGATVAFVPDVFGLTARRVEEQSALAQRQADELAAAQLSVTGNVVAQALTIASTQLQIKAIDSVIADDERNLALIEQQYAAGSADRTDVALAQARLARDRVPLPPLEQETGVAEDALALLIGKPPGEWSPPAFRLDRLTLPADLPLSLPSALVRQRPDILAAAAELHASSAAIGVATGRLFPTLRLSAALAPTALTPAALFDEPNLDWNVLSGLTAPLFHGGELRAGRRAAIDTYRAALAEYRETVLESLRQVADTLQALEHDTELVGDERRSLDADHRALELERQRYAAGKVDLLRLLDAERGYENARVGYARARAARYLDSAELLVALGGGFQQGTVR